MKKLLFTLFGLLQISLVMAKDPGLFKTDNTTQNRPQGLKENLSVLAEKTGNILERRKAIKPGLIVDVENNITLPQKGPIRPQQYVPAPKWEPKS